MAKKEKAPKVKKEKKVRTRKAMNLQEFLAANFNRLRNGLILVLILMIVALYSLGLYTSKLYEGPYIDTSNAYKLAQNLLDFENSMYYGINSYDYDAIAEEMATFLDRETEISEGFEAVEAALKEEPALLERVQEAQSAYDSTVPFDNELAVLLVTMDPETGENLWEEGTEIFEESIMEPFDEAITIMLELNEYFAENAYDYYNSAKLGKIVMISFIVVIAAIFIYAFGRTKRKLTQALLYPMKEINEQEAELARGNINIHVKYDDQDELGDIGRSTNHVAEVLGDMLAEANKIAAGAVSGELSVRGDVDKFEGAYRQLIEGFNSALDALTGPLYKTRDALNAIGVGNIPAEITDEVQGEFVQIVDSLNVCIRTINTLVQDTTNIANAAAMGDITTRADASVHQGAFADIINGVNHSMDILVGHMNNIPIPITIVSRDLDVLFMNKVALENTGKPAEQVHKKKCDTCSNAAICGTPDCVATVAMASGMKASRQTAVTIDGEGHLMTYTAIPLRGAKGKIVAALELATDETEITHAMNQAEADSKKAAMRADYLATQVEKVIQNLDKLAVGNLSLDITCEAASEELADIAANFERINSNLAKTKEAIGNMITDADMMAQAAVAGKLDIRADITKHGGKYADVMVGFNNTLDAVNRPFAEALGVLDKMAAGDLRVRMTGKYEGDYNAMKLALNKTSDNMQSTVAEITKVLAGIGAGDLNQTIKGNYQGDFVAIRDSLNDILSSLNSILIQINTSAEGVAQGSKEVSHASQSLSDSSTQQASAIQQLTASVADVAGQTKQNAGDASKAAEIANSAKGSAQKGNEQMQEMLQSMHEIDQASKAISKVIKVIDDIAFQTNILALNASVEAARAGVHGKGFAVVADEVRNLAEKSANAANETTALIEGSIAKTNKGTEIANETADALKEIRNSIEESADLVMHIAEASADQAKGIEQINIGLEQVARGVQANSATSEESAAASAELYGQAATLKQLVETFKLRKDEEPAFDNLDFDTDDVDEAVETAAPSDINLIPEDIVITLDENDKY